MVAMVIIALISATLGAIAWAVNKNRFTIGAYLPAGAAITAALILWIVTTAIGLDADPATAWIPWILSIVVGGIVAWTVTIVLGRSRHHELVAKKTQILQMR